MLHSKSPLFHRQQTTAGTFIGLVIASLPDCRRIADSSSFRSCRASATASLSRRSVSSNRLRSSPASSLDLERSEIARAADSWSLWPAASALRIRDS